MSNKFCLRHKVIWITGASSGIGAALVRKLATIDCKLAISARRTELLDELLESLGTAKAKFLVVGADVTDGVAMQNAAAEISQKLGPIDVLIANAGTHIPMTIDELDTKKCKDLFQVNFFGVLNALEAVLPSMRDRRSGHLVAVSSVAGYRGLPHAAAYGASKAALSHFMESLRFDLQDCGVAVTVVSPGFVKTPLTDKNDFEMPFLITAERAAEYIVSGVSRGKFEVAFPYLFVFVLKCLRLLPHRLYYRLIRSKVMNNPSSN